MVLLCSWMWLWWWRKRGCCALRCESLSTEGDALLAKKNNGDDIRGLTRYRVLSRVKISCSDEIEAHRGWGMIWTAAKMLWNLDDWRKKGEKMFKTMNFWRLKIAHLWLPVGLFLYGISVEKTHTSTVDPLFSREWSYIFLAKNKKKKAKLLSETFLKKSQGSVEKPLSPTCLIVNIVFN